MMYKRVLGKEIVVGFPESDERNIDNSEKTTDMKIKSPKKHEICLEDPIIKVLQTIRQSRSRLRKSRSTLSILRLKRSYIKFRCLKTLYLRSCVSKSPDSRYFKSISRSSTLSTSYSKSIKTSTTYTLNKRKSGHTSNQRNETSNSLSVCSSLASFGSTSPRSGSSISRSSYSTPKRVNYSRSLVSVNRKKSPSKLPPYKHSCLQSLDSRSHQLGNPCLKVPAIIRFPSKIPVKTSRLKSRGKTTPLKSVCSSTLPNKPCLRSPTSRSPNIRPGIFNETSLNTKQIPTKRSCLKSPLWKLLSKKPSNFKPKCGKDTFSKSPQPAIRNSKSTTPKRFRSKSPESKSPHSTTTSFKSAGTKSPRSPRALSPQPKTPKSNLVYSTTSNKAADSRFFHSSIPKNKPPRFTVRSEIVSSPRPFPKLAKQLTSSSNLSDKKSTRDNSPSKDSPLPLPNLKLRHSKLPRLAASKIHLSKLSLKRSQRLKGPEIASNRRRKLKSLIKLCEYQILNSRARLTRQPKKDTEYFVQSLTTKMDVNYMTELMNCYEKIKSSLTCGKPECKALQERRHRHRAEHHRGSTTSSRELNDEGNPKGGTTISVGTVTQAKNEYEENITNAKSEIEKAIREWAEKIPIQDRPEDQYIKDEAINRLINNIMARDLTDKSRYEDEMLNYEIRRAIEVINLWYPGSQRDRIALKEALVENLFNTLSRLKNNLIEAIDYNQSSYKTSETNTTDASFVPSNASTSQKPVKSVTIQVGNNKDDSKFDDRRTVGNSKKDFIENKTPSFMDNKTPSNTSVSLKPGQNVTIQVGSNNEDRIPTINKDRFMGNKPPSIDSSTVKLGPNVTIRVDSSDDDRRGNIRNDSSMENKTPSNESSSIKPGQNLTIRVGSNNDDRKGNRNKDTFMENQTPSNESSSVKPGLNVTLQVGSNSEDSNFSRPTDSTRKDRFTENKTPSYENYSKTPSDASYSLKSRQSNNNSQDHYNQTPNINERTNSYNRYENPSNSQIQKRQDRPKNYIKIDDNPSYEYTGHVPNTAGQPRRPSLKPGINYPNMNQPDNVRMPNSNFGSNTSQPDTNFKGITDPSYGENDEFKINRGSKERYVQQYDSIVNRPNYIPKNRNYIPKNHSYVPKNHNYKPRNRNYMNIPNFEDNTDRLRDTADNATYGRGNGAGLKNGCAAMNRSRSKRGNYIRQNSNESSNCDISRFKSSFYKQHGRCTIQSEDICGCPGKNKTVKNKLICGIKEDLENEVADWLRKCTFPKFNSLVHKQEIIDEIITQILPYLHRPHSTLNRAVLKKQILKVIRGLGLCTDTTNSKKMVIERLAEELSNRLIGVVSRIECSGRTSWNCDIKTKHPFRYVENVHVGANQINKEYLRQDLIQEFQFSLRGNKISNNSDVLETIADILLNKIDFVYKGIDEVLRKEIMTVLKNANVQNDAEVENITNIIMKNTREIVNTIVTPNNRTNTIVTSGHCLTKPVSIIYTSEHDVTPSFAIPSESSTPKKKKEVSKLSPEEKAYSEDISSVLREWVQSKPAHFKNLDDSNMNEVMIHDLAGELVDQAKLGQLVKTADKETIVTHYILKWIMKFEIVDDLKEAAPYATDLVKKLVALPVPVLTKPHHGNRQTIKNLKQGDDEYFVPEAQDILEDEISIWMNEYPSHIYANPNKSEQNKQVHEFAKKLKESDKDDKDYGEEINDWLKIVLKPSEKNRIESMSTSLSERITKLPTDKTIVANERKKMMQLLEKQMNKENPETSQNMTEENENDNTMKEFIVKYLEHSTDEEDPLAKGAYVKLLTSELRRLSPKIIEELKEGQPLEKFAPQRLFKELQYIKDISDWLKTLPIDPNFNKVGNKNRIEFIINFAREINNIEEERLQNPKAMNFDEMIMSTICMYMQTIPLRFPPNTRVNEYVYPLCIQIFLKREENMPLIPDNQLWGTIADFLDDYIRLNGNDIIDDEAKVEVWAARLLDEIKKMIAENPFTLPRADLNDRLAGVAKPGDETVKRFMHELDYAKEICDWLKNFPLIDFVDDEMIRDLAEKMAESENNTNEKQLVTYIDQWISKLPLDISKQIDVPFIIQQLLNRKNKILEDKTNKPLTLIAPKTITPSSKPVRNQTESSKVSCRGCCPVDDPGSIIVQTINDWCDKLPLVGANEVIKNTKTNLANKLYQKVMEINDNPRLARNDILYMESLLESIDELLENLPPNVKLEGNKKELKSKLFDDLRQCKIFIKEVSLGDEYVRDLEDAVGLALPNIGGGTSEIAAAFEVYKENMVEKFVLDNFDHGTDANTQKYKRKIQNEIDKYAYSAQQRLGSAVPVDKINNEIQGVLFDVKMPVENALQDNVEEIKTKCEVADWVQKLPLRPVSGPAEALKRDRQMRLLARKIHILEFKENPDQKILNEIRKWLTKSPLIREQEQNIYKFADDLQEILNKSRKNRKCIPASAVQESVLEPADEDNSIWVNPNITTDQKKLRQPAIQKTGDILLGLVEKWSNNIPFPSDAVSPDQIDAIKDDITIQIIKKISELNSSPHTFDNDRLYNHLMNQEIENALTRVPQNNTLTQSKAALMHQLTSAIESVKPLIRAERARHEYKKRLDSTVKNFLGSLKNPTAAEKMLLDKVNEEIVDDFLEYQYNKNDEDGKEFYKNKILKALTQYNIVGEKEENKNDIIADTLVETNRLICELQTVDAPENTCMKDEVEEIRMKHEVTNFLDKVSPPPAQVASTRRTAIRDSLAKQLHEIEKTGHTNDNNKKMKAAVARTLKRLGAEDQDNKIEPFIERLQNNEPIRKAPVYSPETLKAIKLAAQPIPQDSKTLQDHGFQVEVEASVYQPDYVPPNWVPPPKPPASSLEQIILFPRNALPSSSGPTGSSRSSQPTQTLGPGAQSAQFPGQYNQHASPQTLTTPSTAVQPTQTQTRARRPLASDAGVQSGPGPISAEDDQTSDDDYLCAMCKKNPCEYYDYYDECDDMMPILRRPMMYPPMMMMPPPFMF